MLTLSQQQALGLSAAHLLPFQQTFVHPGVLGPLNALEEAAAREGFRLGAVSGYRSFERQLAIWNAKARGTRPVLDDMGQPLTLSALDEEAVMWAILRWSALPGTSRHHFGTDVDVVDLSAVAADYSIQLTVAETQPGGPFAPFHEWLSDYLARAQSGFVRPYQFDCGGVAPEPWHLSYLPVAKPLQEKITFEAVSTLIHKSDIALKAVILEFLPVILNRYVQLPL